MSILKNWNFPVPMRNNQRIALEWLEEQLNDPSKRYFFVEAPVGTGKSMFGMCASNYVHAEDIEGVNTCVLTPQKILQRQYETSFPNHLLTTLYGRSNYDCDKGVTCDIGVGFGKKCSDCPYEVIRGRCKTSPNAVMNYQLCLSLLAFSPAFENHNFKLMVFDESHTLESYLTEFNNVVIDQSKCYMNNLTWKLCKNNQEAYDLISTKTLKELYATLERMEQEHPFLTMENAELTQDEGKIKERYLLLEEDAHNMGEFVRFDPKYRDFKYVVTYTEDSFKIKHVFGAFNFEDLVEPHGNKFIFMSSTILDYVGTCREMGIDPNEAAFISLDSEFPVENRPIYYKPVAKMNAGWHKDEESKRRMANEIIRLLNDPHADHNGIIHTVSYQLAEWLVKELDGKIPHEIYHHNGKGANRDQVIDRFTMDHHKLRVLISPSITEGLDLKDDLGRFSIFAKIPFPFLGDQWIFTRKEISQQWYQRQALISVIQGSGRIVRSETDWGMTYILDSSWEQLERSSRHMIPKWWSKALRRV